MDTANSLVNEGVQIFGLYSTCNIECLGLCDKQLACTTCSVHILNKYDKTPEPSEHEMDILFSLPEYFYKYILEYYC
jgi:hypothetical protein